VLRQQGVHALRPGALAGQLLAAADLWLFVTTAARYADAVPWDLLHKARARSIALALVLNRVPRDALDEVPRHLSDLLAAEGLERAPVFVVPETVLERGLIPATDLEPITQWLSGLTADAEARATVVRTTLEGALESLDERVGTVTTQIEAQASAAAELEAAVARAFDAARADIEDALSGGSLLRGEVLARWHEVVGSGELMRSLESRIGWLRDRLKQSLRGTSSGGRRRGCAPRSQTRSGTGSAASSTSCAPRERPSARPVGRSRSASTRSVRRS
jgi:hypothetical protein